MWKQQQVLKNYKDSASLPFYGKLPTDIDAVTLNYTTFLRKALPQSTICFHGGLDEYVRMDTRQLIPIENIETLDIVTFIKESVRPNIHLEGSVFNQHKHVIPSLIPPLKLKPVLSQK